MLCTIFHRLVRTRPGDFEKCLRTYVVMNASCQESLVKCCEPFVSCLQTFFLHSTLHEYQASPSLAHL